MRLGIFANEIFYVGKGKGNRVFAHEKEANRILRSGRMMELSHKDKVIWRLWQAGMEVAHEIIAYELTEDEAYELESARIREIGLENLTNATYGRRPRTR